MPRLLPLAARVTGSSLPEGVHVGRICGGRSGGFRIRRITCGAREEPEIRTTPVAMSSPECGLPFPLTFVGQFDLLRRRLLPDKEFPQYLVDLGDMVGEPFGQPAFELDGKEGEDRPLLLESLVRGPLD